MVDIGCMERGRTITKANVETVHPEIPPYLPLHPIWLSGEWGRHRGKERQTRQRRGKSSRGLTVAGQRFLVVVTPPPPPSPVRFAP